MCTTIEKEKAQNCHTNNLVWIHVKENMARDAEQYVKMYKYLINNTANEKEKIKLIKLYEMESGTQWAEQEVSK